MRKPVQTASVVGAIALVAVLCFLVAPRILPPRQVTDPKQAFDHEVAEAGAPLEELHQQTSGPLNVQSGTMADEQEDESLKAELHVLEDAAALDAQRLDALASLYQQRESMTDDNLIQFWRTLHSLAQEEGASTSLRADAIWTLRSVGLLLQTRQLISREQLSKDCSFLIEYIDRGDLDPILRQRAISASGDLQLVGAIPGITAILTDPQSLNNPELARNGCIALANIAGTQSIPIVSTVFTSTTNLAVFGSAAYALGTISSPTVLPSLLEHRSRLGDNSSVDNAIQSMSSNVMATLAEPSSPSIIAAIEATRSLWKDEQRAEYVPALERLLLNADSPPDVRLASADRLLEHASTLQLPAEKQYLSRLLPLLANDQSLSNQMIAAQSRIGAVLLSPDREME
jgi:hypothetical protein